MGEKRRGEEVLQIFSVDKNRRQDRVMRYKQLVSQVGTDVFSGKLCFVPELNKKKGYEGKR